jgi:hypothetical protein
VSWARPSDNYTPADYLGLDLWFLLKMAAMKIMMRMMETAINATMVCSLGRAKE